MLGMTSSKSTEYLQMSADLVQVDHFLWCTEKSYFFTQFYLMHDVCRSTLLHQIRAVVVDHELPAPVNTFMAQKQQHAHNDP